MTASVSAAPTTSKVTASAVQTVTAKPAKRHWFEVGKATWYGGDFNGRKTANGDTFNENELTAAHRTLPLGSWIRVTNLKNKRSTMVRVTDRGPWVNNAVLDLSHAAAEKLGFSGTAKVKIEPVDKFGHPLTEVAQLTQNKSDQTATQ
ncbi:MAG: septal ring lytic transglycosylase RlpA family protein [Acidobacteriaceae bacterium]|nr:septal ring lytic transglycosylase RlpA family protein [Acidobacteriaceae bacterium]